MRISIQPRLEIEVFNSERCMVECPFYDGEWGRCSLFQRELEYVSDEVIDAEMEAGIWDGFWHNKYRCAECRKETNDQE